MNSKTLAEENLDYIPKREIPLIRAPGSWESARIVKNGFIVTLHFPQLILQFGKFNPRSDIPMTSVPCR